MKFQAFLTLWLQGRDLNLRPPSYFNGFSVVPPIFTPIIPQNRTSYIDSNIKALIGISLFTLNNSTKPLLTMIHHQRQTITLQICRKGDTTYKPLTILLGLSPFSILTMLAIAHSSILLKAWSVRPAACVVKITLESASGLRFLST